MSDIKYSYYQTSAGYKISGKTDNDILLAGGGCINSASLDYIPKSHPMFLQGTQSNINSWNNTFKNITSVSLADLNNTSLVPGNYKAEAYGIAGLPGSYNSILNLGQYSGGGYSQQLGVPFQNGTYNGLWLRTSVAANYGDWHRMWDDSQFTQADVNSWNNVVSTINNKYDKSGGIVSGTVSIQSGTAQTMVLRATFKPANYATWVTYDGNALAYFGADGGATGAGDNSGQNFCIRALQKMYLQSDIDHIKLNNFNALTVGNFGTFNTWNTANTDLAKDNRLTIPEIGWKNYGNGHTITDVSSSLSPTGASVNNTDSDAPWSAGFPTLMGWNGANTYGVRVDSARVADIVNTLKVRDNGTRLPNDFVPNANPHSVRFDFINAYTFGGSGNYGGVMTFSPFDGGTGSTGDSSYQLVFGNRTGIDGGGTPMLKLRKGIDGQWANSANTVASPWYQIWSEADFSQTNINNWNAAFSWGNHALQGYIKEGQLNTEIQIENSEVRLVPSEYHVDPTHYDVTVSDINRLITIIGDYNVEQYVDIRSIYNRQKYTIINLAADRIMNVNFPGLNTYPIDPSSKVTFYITDNGEVIMMDKSFAEIWT